MYAATDNYDQSLTRIADVFSKKNSGIIVLPTNPSYDAVAAAISLYLSLLKMDKTIGLICSSPVNVDLFGADKIQNTLTINGDNLIISFPYKDGAIDKVDCQIQGNSFNIIITPRPGQPKLDPHQAKYSYAGGRFDFIITIDAPNLNSLGEIYTENQNQFQGKDIINIDRHLINGNYGTINLINKSVSSISELIFKIIQQLKLEIDKDIATNLYAGIASGTNNFSSYSVNAETFEIAAQLLRMGAVKKTFKKTVKSSPSTSIETVEKEPIPDEKKTTPQDWLKPKIFRGGGLI